MMDMTDALDQRVLVWLARLSELRPSLPALEPLLDVREKERAERFRLPDDRDRFVIGRGLLRHALQRFAPELPAGWELDYTDRGRPVLPKASGDLEFSISHTRDFIALAFARRARVGIDLEFVQPTVDLMELAERILSESDFVAFSTFSRPEMQLAFYRAWTRKEAYLKARGEGIATALQDVSVSFTAVETSGLMDRRENSTAHWRLHLVPVPSDYVGSLACDDAMRRPAWCRVWIEGDALQVQAV
jgi:4'-phosphopantetheinyl transferase